MKFLMKSTYIMIAIVLGYAALLTSSNAAPTKGELRHLVTEQVYSAYPNCSPDNRDTVGDHMWCTDRALVLLDDQLNDLYQDVMHKFRLLDNKRAKIRDVQRQWINFRDSECIYEDSTDGMFSSSKCVLNNIALSIHYLNRLKKIQFDADGLKAMDEVIADYHDAVS